MLDLLDRDSGACAQLDGALADAHRVASRITQLDARLRTDGDLTADLHPGTESGLKLLRLPPRPDFGRVSFGEDAVPARIDHVAGDTVGLADGRDADSDALCRPFLARPLDALLVVVPELLELDPRCSGALRALQKLQGPAPGTAIAHGGLHTPRCGPSQRRQRAVRREEDLLASLEDPHGDQRLAAGERQPARVEKLERIVRGGRAGEEIVFRPQGAREQGAAEKGEEPSARRRHLRR